MPQLLAHPDHFSAEELCRLASTLSAPRLSRYIRACQNDVSTALRLYQWNLEISAAFLPPLHFLEVSLRNAVAEAVEAAYGPNWTHSRSFMFSLSASRTAFNLRQHLMETAARHAVPGKVIADLNFVFWQKMFVRNFDSLLWNRFLRAVFPYLDAQKTVQQCRAEFHDSLETLRILRNRVAHHEPIFQRDLHHDLHLIDTLIGYRCQHTVNWMRRIEKVSKLLAHHPLAASGQVQSA